MFKLEFFSLLKEIKSTQGENRKELLKSLNKLLKENPQEYEYFINQGMISQEMQQIINEAQQLFETSIQKNEDEDIQRIKNSYYKWLEEYQNNANTTPTMRQITQELVEFYTPNRFDTLKKVLEINESNEFEAFKQHLKNTIRAYFAEKIENYIESNKYQQLWFFPRLRKNKQIRELLKDINNYQFDKEKMSEVLQ